jgi:hypothetical protein
MIPFALTLKTNFDDQPRLSTTLGAFDWQESLLSLTRIFRCLGDLSYIDNDDGVTILIKTGGWIIPIGGKDQVCQV